MHPRFHDLRPTSAIAFRRTTLFKLTDRNVHSTLLPRINVNISPVPFFARLIASDAIRWAEGERGERGGGGKGGNMGDIIYPVERERGEI